jgi:hypothetical protein
LDEGGAEAIEGAALGGDVGFVGTGVAVADADDFGGAGDGEGDLIVSGGNGAALGVGDGGVDDEGVLAIGDDLRAVGGEGNCRGGAGGFDFFGGDDLPVFVGAGFQGAGGIVDLPIDVGIGGDILAAEALAVEE